MKKLLLTIFVSLIFGCVFAPVPKQVTLFRAADPLERLLSVIIQIESSGNPLAVNIKEQAFGLLQIRPVMLKEVNRIVGYEKYTVIDCLDSLKSIEMFKVVQRYHNPGNDLKTACVTWNGKSKHNHYWTLVSNRLNKL